MFGRAKVGKLPPIEDELLLRPAIELSKQIKAGKLTSTQVVEAYIARIKTVQPIINAMCDDRFEEALTEARKIDELLKADSGDNKAANSDTGELLSSPLLGVPITVKESIAIKGKRLTAGLWSRRAQVADEDSHVVRALRRFGLVPICTSNVPEGTFYWADCRNKVYGQSNNPYDISRITGASSGGEGALLASGASVIGIGSDIGGSLRLPGHFCGVFSHKASPFLVPEAGNYPPVRKDRLRMFSIGPMTRYACDLRPLLKCLLHAADNACSEDQQPALGKPSNIAQLRKELLASIDDKVDLSQLTIKYANLSLSKQLQVTQEIAEAQQKVLDALSSVYSCKLSEVNIDYLYEKALIAWKYLLSAPTVLEANEGSKEGEQINAAASKEEGKQQPEVASVKTTKQETTKSEQRSQEQQPKQEEFKQDELLQLFSVSSIPLEMVRLVFGSSKHTAESLLTLAVSFMRFPSDASKTRQLATKFEKLIASQRKELYEMLGSNSVLLVPTMPTTAYKHNEALFRTNDVRFTAAFNSLQVPVTHATYSLSQSSQLPFGFSCIAAPFCDNLTLSVAEAIESSFGGWKEPPQKALSSTTTTTKAEPVKRLQETATSKQTSDKSHAIASQATLLDKKA